ncbi:hypothetical protein [Bordetella genomosp. 12]|uniref:hypothetical protein n=1 Tax=Bordetella genomosp. 12 TaxID=463035 RepID=UPI0011778BCB|nr:hypothetical protein [Bordetella genomosp. 12]
MTDIENGKYPMQPCVKRTDFVIGLHAEMNADLLSGSSTETLRDRISKLRMFFAYADQSGKDLDVDTALDVFLQWTDFLIHRSQKIKEYRDNKSISAAPLKASSIYAYAKVISDLLDVVLDRRASVLNLTRVRSPRRQITAAGRTAEKTSRKDFLLQGRFSAEICRVVDVEFLRDLPPTQVYIRDDACLRIGKWGVPSEGNSIDYGLGRQDYLISLRIEAELHLFISQTSMNVSQAVRLNVGNLRYTSYTDGYRVTIRKGRRQGDVTFEIYKEYRAHLERYLAWRRIFCPSESRLFPLSQEPGAQAELRALHRFRRIFRALDVPYVCPRKLRGMRINFLMASSVAMDVESVAETMQHGERTLIQVYHRPSFHRATAEIGRFWKKATVVQEKSIAPGGCLKNVAVAAHIPNTAPRPDCVRPSGCLWCESHRDIDEFDYVWALTTFGQLKQLEFSVSGLEWSDDAPSPVQSVIEKIRGKLRWLEESSTERLGWVEEASERVAEGYWHPDWEATMQSVEHRLWQ